MATKEQTRIRLVHDIPSFGHKSESNRVQ